MKSGYYYNNRSFRFGLPRILWIPIPDLWNRLILPRLCIL